MKQSNGLKKLAKRQNSDWKKWSSYWKLLKNGSRPSEEDISIIANQLNKHLKNKKESQIVILGSTPEFRDMCSVFSSAYNTKVTCVELVDYMYEAMSDLVFKKNNKEQVVFCNWLNIKLPSGFADVIIGDLTEGNIPAELLPQYYAEMNRLLKKDGIYVTRTTAYPAKSKAKPMITLSDLERSLKKYRDRVLVGDLTVHNAANLFGAELAWDSWYKLNNNTLSISAYAKEIKALDKQKDELVREIMETFHKIWDSAMNKFWDYYSQEKTLADYCRNFREVKSVYAQSYPTAKYTPIISMIRK